ncbi:putative permease [Streptomyces chrestomyceticus JCM 4735]|uniref:Permease n=1 Tax=Streptomyces chrestomyceticus JCM 4735 TaxID=1306181 RepID=A0A7U9KYF9_9ACTN|nr:MFS transporter [Streptomyces chrestomyceticus]GCD37722.1 putative permease [Streptomyces chrestomyceticus JCM 4735]
MIEPASAPPRTDRPPRSGLTRPTALLLAATSAVTAANVYLNQPLLGAAARSLGVAPDVLGAVPTATQLGYAAGILLLVPAGDSHDRRRLILGLGTASALALAACAVAPSVTWLVVAGFAVGLLSPVPQLVTPLAVALAADGGNADRGRIVGTVQAGLLVGVLASRAYSGALAEQVGWRAVFGCSCVLTLLTMLVLSRALPRVPAAAAASYRSTLASLPRLFAAHPLVRRITVSGALVGIAFGAFWTTLTFLLSEEYGYGSTEIGLFGLVAAASALASPYAGRLADRLGRRGALAALIGLVIAGWLLLLPGGGSLWWLLAGVVVLDVGVWGSQAASQTSLFSLDPAVHSRLNTLYFTLRFSGIAVGSLAGTVAWSGGGWPAVVVTGTVTALAGLCVAVSPDRFALRRRGRS